MSIGGPYEVLPSHGWLGVVPIIPVRSQGTPASASLIHGTVRGR